MLNKLEVQTMISYLPVIIFTNSVKINKELHVTLNSKKDSSTVYTSVHHSSPDCAVPENIDTTPKEWIGVSRRVGGAGEGNWVDVDIF